MNISFAGKDTICTGTCTSLTASVSGGTAPYTYAWNPSSGLNCTTCPNIVACPSATTEYSLTVTDATACSQVKTVMVTVSQYPHIQTPNTTICPGQSVMICGVGGDHYLWLAGPTTSCISVSPSSTTTYTLFASSGACASKDTVTVTVHSICISINPASTTICAGDMTSLCAASCGPSGLTSYTWSTGSTAPCITVDPSATNSYSVMATDGYGCTGIATTTVVVNTVLADHLPVPNICSGQSATLCASGGTQYSWSNGATTNCTIINNATTTSTYSVWVSSGTCKDSASIMVVVDPMPVPAITGITQLCNGESTSLTASGGGTYSWNTGQTSSSIIVTPPATATYSVDVHLGACKASAAAIVTVTSAPIADFSLSVSYPTVTCTDATTGCTVTSWHWNFGDGTSSYVQNPSHIYASPGNYTICCKVSCGSCSDSVCKNVTVLSAEENFLEQYITVFPNPSAGRFSITASGIKITSAEVYNLVGKKEASFIPSAGSTFQVNAEALPAGIYFLKLTAKEGTVTRKIIIDR